MAAAWQMGNASPGHHGHCMIGSRLDVASACSICLVGALRWAHPPQHSHAPPVAMHAHSLLWGAACRLVGGIAPVCSWHPPCTAPVAEADARPHRDARCCLPASWAAAWHGPGSLVGLCPLVCMVPLASQVAPDHIAGIACTSPPGRIHHRCCAWRCHHALRHYPPAPFLRQYRPPHATLGQQDLQQGNKEQQVRRYMLPCCPCCPCFQTFLICCCAPMSSERLCHIPYLYIF
jgi:hypothetical protein